jgi:putative sigma-54 modulation protein
MKLKITFKHLKHTPALDERITEKSQRFEKYFQGNITIQWICWVKDDKHWAEMKLHGPKFDFFAKAHADNMYKSLDLVVEKMQRQLDKQKDLRRDKLHNHAFETPKYREISKIMKDELEAFEDWEEKSA